MEVLVFISRMCLFVHYCVHATHLAKRNLPKVNERVWLDNIHTVFFVVTPEEVFFDIYINWPPTCNCIFIGFLTWFTTTMCRKVHYVLLPRLRFEVLTPFLLGAFRKLEETIHPHTFGLKETQWLCKQHKRIAWQPIYWHFDFDIGKYAKNMELLNGLKVRSWHLNQKLLSWLAFTTVLVRGYVVWFSYFVSHHFLFNDEPQYLCIKSWSSQQISRGFRAWILG